MLLAMSGSEVLGLLSEYGPVVLIGLSLLLLIRPDFGMFRKRVAEHKAAESVISPGAGLIDVIEAAGREAAGQQIINALGQKKATEILMNSVPFAATAPVAAPGRSHQANFLTVQVPSA